MLPQVNIFIISYLVSVEFWKLPFKVMAISQALKPKFIALLVKIKYMSTLECCWLEESIYICSKMMNKVK
jgi:hypothetical protein